MAEALLRAWADPRVDLVVTSAGMRALVGHPMDRGAASALGQLGIDPTRHRARQFEAPMAGAADLVLTAEANHREEIIGQLPTAFRRVFTIKEFTRLAPLLTERDPRAAVAQAAGMRAMVARPHDPHADDVADPYRRATVHSKTVAGELTAAVKTMLDTFGFSPRPARPDGARRPMPFPR
jgi:protein-tyrosine phosphatase